ncbi:MAG: iron-sulfur cluster assembly protein [Bacteroidales bacterium]|nr:iron-sulfur cluster assembly protein [Bacteroidales bacterium]MDD4670733.1 iron-sulfur cluster assembly protein [Bacteroidales bacterium]
MENKETNSLEQDIITALHQVYDPEVPVDIYELGLIYGIDTDKDNNVTITMTLTAPNCPIADQVIEDVKEAVLDVPGTKDVKVNLVFEPEWNIDMMSEAAKLELNML